MKLRLSGRGLAAVLSAGLSMTAVAQEGISPPPDAPDFDTNAEPRLIQAAQINNLSPALAEVVRLAQSGAGESVTLAYIQKAPAYHITGDEIIYLEDLGISEAVLKALVDHSQSSEAAVAAAPAAPAPTNAPAVVTTVPAPPAEVGEFYQPLTPYGSWVEVAPYGWCWQPTVAVVYRGWQPYCDNGYWLWSDSGWYWHSYYSWGWAPFHYGRWFNHPRRGWCWAPDRVWGSSWVCWRNSPGYAGWAPLPPGAHFSVGIGWTFRGRAVGPSFGFGIASSHFAFVSTAHFADRRVSTRRLPPREVNVVFNRTTVVNNYVAGSGNRVINRGVDRAKVESASGTRLHEVAVRELPRDGARTTMPDQLTRQGNSDVVYRPGPKIDVSHTPLPPAARRSPVSNRPEAQPRQESVIRAATPSPRPGQPSPNPAERSRTPGPSVTPSAPAPRATPPAARSTPAPSAPAQQTPSSPAVVTPNYQPRSAPPERQPRATPPSQRQSSPSPSHQRSRDDDRR